MAKREAQYEKLGFASTLERQVSVWRYSYGPKIELFLVADREPAMDINGNPMGLRDASYAIVEAAKGSAAYRAIVGWKGV